MSDALVSEALAQVEQGWAAFPLGHNSKKPVTPNGFHDATTDPERVRTMLSAKGAGNYGLVWPNGAAPVVTFDLDDGADGPGDGPTWQKRVAELQARYGKLPATRVVTTPSGGRHATFGWPPDVPIPKGDALFGFTVRWPMRGYLVGPGSTIDGREYVSNGQGIAPLPRAWVEAALAEAHMPARSEDVITIEGGYQLPERVEGSRYGAIRDYVASRYRRGLSREELWAGVRDVLAPRFAKPLPEPDLRERFERAWKDTPERLGPPLAPPEREPLPVAGPRQVIQAGAFVLMEFPGQCWRVHEMLPAEGFAAIVGTDKEGKSLLALQAGLCIAAGEPLLGRGTDPCPVLLIEEEGSAQAFQQRLHTQAASLGLLPRLDKLPLHVSIRQRWRLDSDEDVREIEAQADAIGARVILIGPLSQLASIDENANRDMNAVARRLLDMLARRGGLLVLSHHRRKVGGDQPRTVREFFDSTRGGNALMAAVDAAVGVRRDPEATDGLIFVLLRDGPGQRLHIVFDPAQLLIFPTEAPPTQKAPLDAVARLVAEADGPVNRSYVAAKLGISPTTAGDRLDVLEADGQLVTSTGARNQKLYSPRPATGGPPKGGTHLTG